MRNINRELRRKTGGGDHGSGARLPPEPGEPNAFHAFGRNPGDVWSIGTASSRLAHFAVFPERLVEKPILAGSPPGGLVLDPFCGSGTTLAVVRRLGRRSLGIELKAAYVELARERLAALITRTVNTLADEPLEPRTGDPYDAVHRRARGARRLDARRSDARKLPRNAY